MKKLSKNVKIKDNETLKFPDLSSIEKEHVEVSLEEVIMFSEELLPIKNKTRKKSPAAQYTPFKLK